MIPWIEIFAAIRFHDMNNCWLQPFLFNLFMNFVDEEDCFFCKSNSLRSANGFTIDMILAKTIWFYYCNYHCIYTYSSVFPIGHFLIDIQSSGLILFRIDGPSRKWRATNKQGEKGNWSIFFLVIQVHLYMNCFITLV